MTSYTPRPLQHTPIHTCTSLGDYWPFCWLCYTNDRKAS